LEINILIWDVVVTTDRRAAAAAYDPEQLEQRGFVLDVDLSANDLLDSPYLLFGTEREIAEQVAQLRAETGASYLSVFPHLMDAFQPVLTRLHGT
jgi:hypothetical protein